jgi:hypothetical protein
MSTEYDYSSYLRIENVIIPPDLLPGVLSYLTIKEILQIILPLSTGFIEFVKKLLSHYGLIMFHHYIGETKETCKRFRCISFSNGFVHIRNCTSSIPNDLYFLKRFQERSKNCEPPRIKGFTEEESNKLIVIYNIYLKSLLEECIFTSKDGFGDIIESLFRITNSTLRKHSIVLNFSYPSSDDDKELKSKKILL